MVGDIKGLLTYDKSTEAKDQAITASAAGQSPSAFGSGNIGEGNPIRFHVEVTEDFDNLTSLTINLQESSDDGDSDAYSDVPGTKGVIALANLTKGSVVIDTVVPPGTEKYLRAYFEVTGTNPSAGKVRAKLTRR